MTSPNQSFWKQTANRSSETPNPQWIELLRNNLQSCHPQKLAELAANDDLEAYLKVRVLSAQQQLQLMQDSGMDLPTANELALQDLLQPAPSDEDRPEPWEVEAATADMEAAIAAQLFNL